MPKCKSRTPFLTPAAITLLGLLMVFAPAPASPAEAATKIARCLVVSSGQVDFRGRCRFGSDGVDGSFYIEHLNRNRPLTQGVMSISVTMIGRGVAEVRGLTRQGINSRWGRATRSTRRPACWVGSDFTICAWACRTRSCR